MEERSLDEFVDQDDEGDDNGAAKEATSDDESHDAGTANEATSDDESDEQPGDGAGASESTGGGAETHAQSADDRETAETVPNDAVDPSTVDPASPTSQYEPGGVGCEECDDRARRLWNDEGRTVCGSCKSW